MSHIDDLKVWFWQTLLYHLQWDHKQNLGHTTGSLPVNTVPTRAIVPGAVTPDRLSFDPATQAELDAETAARAAADTALAAPSYVVLAASATLANERVLTAGTGVTLTDGGAGGAVTIATTALTEDAFDRILTDTNGDVLSDALGNVLLGV